MHYSLSARLAIAISAWLLARAGVEWKLQPPRDKQGRFKPKDGGGYGLPKSIPHHVADLMHDMGVTKQMYESAAVPLVLPDDLEDVPALELCLRGWILHNLDHWVHGKGRNPYTMIQALMCTWAIDLYKWKPPKRMLRRFLRAADTTVGEDLASSRSGTTLGSQQDSNRHDATTPRKDMQAAAINHWSERLQRVADLKQANESGREFAAAQPTPIPLTHDAQDLTWRRGAVAVQILSRATSTSDRPTFRPSDFLLAGDIGAESTAAWKASPKSPDPPWYGPPPHPPPTPHGTLTT